MNNDSITLTHAEVTKLLARLGASDYITSGRNAAFYLAGILDSKGMYVSTDDLNSAIEAEVAQRQQAHNG